MMDPCVQLKARAEEQIRASCSREEGVMFASIPITGIGSLSKPSTGSWERGMSAKGLCCSSVKDANPATIRSRSAECPHHARAASRMESPACSPEQRAALPHAFLASPPACHPSSFEMASSMLHPCRVCAAQSESCHSRAADRGPLRPCRRLQQRQKIISAHASSCAHCGY
ncbi:hypothetical protein BU16DRAFT_221242 [Lophium mytilinum]|uniref:Uncharacterized protein n=1 Tax=Lophium mytilinum TaxID=390894 RepID=A0A6A6QA89_9PEZI|nr:hypothetical protein BU16DRAFT_221242 [Lophium mytilinum]